MGNVINMIGGGENVNAEVATQKTDIELIAKQIASVQLDFNSTYVWGKYTASGGDLLDYVYSTDSSAYPDGSTQGGYYYKWVKPVEDFATSTWAEIKAAVQKGIGGLDLSKCWAVGDTKSVTLTTGETIELQIAGFNHDTYSDGVTAPVTLVMKNCLNITAPMNSSDTNSGGYPASAMKTYVETNIYDKLPSDLKTIVAPVKKKCYTTYNQASSLSEANYNVWLLAEAEVFDSVTQTVGSGEGTKYPIFTDDTSRSKKRNGLANIWWLRSARSSHSTVFVLVNYGGSIVSISYSSENSFGVVVGLCVR